MKNHRTSHIQNRLMESWSHGVMVLFALPAQRFTVSPCPQGAHGGQEPQPSWQASWVEYFLPLILQAAWDVAFKYSRKYSFVKYCQIVSHQLSNQSLNSHSEILWSWGCKTIIDNSLSNAHMRLCHLLPRVKRRHGKLAQDSWELWSLSAYFVAGAVERHKVTGFVRHFRGVQLLSNLFWIRQGSLPFGLWSYGNLDQQWQAGPPKRISALPGTSLQWHPYSHSMSNKGIPGEKFNYKQAAKCRSQHRSMLKAWSGCIPLSGNSQKKRPNYMRTAEESKHSTHRVHRHGSSQRLYKRLTVDPQSTAFLYKLQSAPDRLPVTSVTSVTSSSCWESSVPYRPDLPPSLRNPEVDASTWSHASVRSMYAAIMVYIVCVFIYLYI